jgi:hypothetical protein
MQNDFHDAERLRIISALTNEIVRHGLQDKLGWLWQFEAEGFRYKLRTYNNLTTTTWRASDYNVSPIECYATYPGSVQKQVVNTVLKGREFYRRLDSKWLSVLAEYVIACDGEKK